MDHTQAMTQLTRNRELLKKTKASVEGALNAAAAANSGLELAETVTVTPAIAPGTLTTRVMSTAPGPGRNRSEPLPIGAERACA